MTFNKPCNITLTQMAQWVDNILNIDTCDENILVEYLYHLIFYNAQIKNLFNNIDTYDDFSLYCVSKILIRLNNKTKPKIKSVVNYINKVLTPWYAEYVRLFCTGSPELNTQDFDVSDFGDYLIDTTSELDYASYNFCCLNISDVVRKHLRRIPYKKNSCEWNNIYTSCLLTLHDRLESASSFYENSVVFENPILLSRIVRDLKLKPPILYHIEDSYSTYVSVLVNELIHAIATEISFSSSVKVSPTNCLKNLVVAANNLENE